MWSGGGKGGVLRPKASRPYPDKKKSEVVPLLQTKEILFQAITEKRHIYILLLMQEELTWVMKAA